MFLFLFKNNRKKFFKRIADKMLEELSRFPEFPTTVKLTFNKDVHDKYSVEMHYGEGQPYSNKNIQYYIYEDKE